MLSRLGKHNDVKKLLQQDKVREIFKKNETNELFSHEYDEHFKVENISRKNVLAALKPTSVPAKKQRLQSANAGQKQQPSSAPPSNGKGAIRRIKGIPETSR